MSLNVSRGGSAKSATQPSAEPLRRPLSRRGGRSRSFWYCFAAFQLAVSAAMAPLCWLVLALTSAALPSPPPLGAVPAIIVTAVGAGLCLASVGLLCGAQCVSAASAAAPAAGCLARLLWLRIFTAGAGVCAHLAATGLLLHSAAQLLATSDAATRVAAMTGLAAVDAGQAAAACVHIYNCVTAVRLSWRVAAEGDDDEDGESDGEAAAKVAPLSGAVGDSRLRLGNAGEELNDLGQRPPSHARVPSAKSQV